MAETAIQKYEIKPLAPVGQDVKDLLRCDRMYQGLMEIMPSVSDEPNPERHIKRLIAQASLAFMQNTSLQNCTQLSVLDSMLAVAATGLSLAKSTGEAYLVPFANVCTFMPGYKGLVRLVVQSGAALAVDAKCVYKGEQFDVGETERGTLIRHKPNYAVERKDAEIEAVYARFYLAGGVVLVTVMNRGEIESIRKQSKSGNSPAWRNHWGEMARKTCIKRGTKTLPTATSDKARARMLAAIAADDRTGGFIDQGEYDEAMKELQSDRAAEFDRRLGAPKPEEPEVLTPADWAQRSGAAWWAMAEEDLGGNPKEHHAEFEAFVEAILCAKMPPASEWSEDIHKRIMADLEARQSWKPNPLD